MYIEIEARIPLTYLPSNWRRLVVLATEESEHEICKVSEKDFQINNGLVFKSIIGNGCYDDIIGQLNKLAELLGSEVYVKSRCL
jgi:hypothetical protein